MSAGLIGIVRFDPVSSSGIGSRRVYGSTPFASASSRRGAADERSHAGSASAAAPVAAALRTGAGENVARHRTPSTTWTGPSASPAYRGG